MGDQQTGDSGAIQPHTNVTPNHKVLSRVRDAAFIFLVLIFIVAIILFWRLKSAWANQENTAPAQTASLSTAPERTSAPAPDPEIEDIRNLAPQQQAERFLQRASFHPQHYLPFTRHTPAL